MAAQMMDSEHLLAEKEVEPTPKDQTSPRRPLYGLALSASFAAACGLGLHWTAQSSEPAQPARSSSLQFQGLAAAKKNKTASADQDAGSACAALGEGCLESHCCSGPGSRCYGKDENWAECRYECMPGRNPTSLDKGEWSCKELSDVVPGEPPKCSKSGEDCTGTGCCADPGLQCFEKVEGAWATCKPRCTAGIDLRDADDHPWSCNPLGPKTPDVAPWVWSDCAGPHASCTEAGCCSTPGMQCYEHDEFYGECMAECNTQGWNCKPRGYRLPQPAPQESDNNQGPVADWVAEKCAKEGENCSKSTCCAEAGTQCYSKNSTFGGCRASCDGGMPNLYDEDEKPWSCQVLGPRTPGFALQPWEQRKNLSAWVEKTCGEQYSESCLESKCCKNIGDGCFEKNKDYATCMPECAPGKHEGDEGNWTCKQLGPVTHRPYPSLFCFHVIQSAGYEPGLVGASMGSGAGIWECDKYALFSTDKFMVGEGDSATETVTFEPAEVGQSKDYTAANAHLFMNVWESVRNQGLYKETDWTIKVDPDAVLIPSRLRKRLDKFTGRKGYVVNCAKPYMPEGPMMFGALEAFSRLAMDVYMWKTEECKNGLPWQQWGEDLYMGKCMEKLGVERLNDWQIYSDGVCRGVDGGDPDAAAFHPMKDVDSWMGCLEQTRNPHAPSGDMDGNAPQWFKDYMESYR